MKSGYNIFWTNHALEELQNTIDYLQENFSEKEINKLAFHLENYLHLIAQNPTIFVVSESKIEVRKLVLIKYNSLYYRILEENKSVEILSFFSNRQHPKKRKL